MKTAVISCIDDNVKANFENDFAKTLRENAQYKGDVFLLYYGTDTAFAKRIKEKYQINVLFYKKSKNFRASNQRMLDLNNVILNLPKYITHIMHIDGADVWFQDKIDQAFMLSSQSYGFVAEDDFLDKGFNLHCISQIKNQKIKNDFLQNSKNKKLINSGMLVGKIDDVKNILKKVGQITLKINQDFFALDQAIFNYVIYNDTKGVFLPDKFNYTLLSKRNQFYVKNGLFFDQSEYLPSIIHNTGNNFRTLPKGRESLKFPVKNPENLPGDFWAITTFFNPVGYKNKIKNYKIFRQSTKKQGLKLVTVELGFGKSKFELNKNDAEILIQLRTNDIMWHKERLINIGFNALPKNCDKFAWLDADIIFLNDNWIKEACQKLQEYSIVQPYADFIRLSKNKKNIKNPEQIAFAKEIDLEDTKGYGLANKVSQLGPDILEKPVEFHGQAGLAWAARKNIFENIGVLDKSPLPVLDLFMAHLFYRNKFNQQCKFYLSEHMEKSFLNWANIIDKKVKKSVYFAQGTILHLWHGKMNDRNYIECSRIAKEYDLNPENDIKIAENNCYKWAGNKPQLQKDVYNYFIKRKEGRFFINKIIFKKIILNFKNNFENLNVKIDRFLGKVGTLLKKISPKFYWVLKRFEQKLRNYIMQKKINKILKLNWQDYKKDLFPKDRRMQVLEQKNVLGLNSENVRFLINELVKVFAKNGVYLEVGTFLGCSFIGAALFNKSARCIGIDDFSEFDDWKKNEAIFYENKNKFKELNNLEFYKGDYKKVIKEIFDKDQNLKINVYFYDAKHSYENQLNGLRIVLPYLAKQCIIVVDDVNWKQVEKANQDFLKQNPDFVSLFKIKTKANMSSDWWNGIEIMGRGF